MHTSLLFKKIDWQDEIPPKVCFLFLCSEETINKIKIENKIYNSPALILTKVSIYL